MPVSGLLTFDGATHADPAIAAWFDARPGMLGDIARHWFARIRACGPDVRELFHDGCPVACVEDAPFAQVGVYRQHVNVGFFHGDALPDPAGLLQGAGRFMRHVKLRAGEAVDAAALQALVDAAHADIRTRLASRGA